MADTQIATATPPQMKFDPEIEAQLQGDAMALVKQVETGLTEPTPKLTAQFENFGSKERDLVGQKIGLLSKKVVDLKALKGEEGKMAKDLVEFRKAMDQLNPHRHKQSGLGRFLNMIPIIGPIIQKKWDSSVLKDIAVNHDTLNNQVNAAMLSLDANRDNILQDNIQLEQLYEQVESAQEQVRRRIYIGNILLQELDKKIAAAPDKVVQDKLTAVKSVVLRRMQSYHVLVETNAQALVSANLTIDNNRSLSETIGETMMVAQTTLPTALAILAALASQRNAISATEVTQDYMSDMLVQNAKSLGSATDDIARLRNSPVLSMEKIQEAHRAMIDTIRKLDTIRDEGDKQAVQNIASLSRMGDELQTEANKLKDARQLGTTINPDEPVVEGQVVRRSE